MSHRLNWRTIKKSLLLFNLVLCLFLIFTNIFLYYVYMRDSYNETLRLSYSGTIAQVAKSYETLIDHAESVINEAGAYGSVFLQTAENVGGDTVGRMEMIKALERILSQSNFLREVSFWNCSSNLVYTAGAVHNGVVLLEEYPDAALFLNNMNSAVTLITPQLQQRDSTVYLAIVLRIYGADQLYGMLAGSVDLNTVSQYVLDKEIATEGHNDIYILDQDGQVIYPYGAVFAPDTSRCLIAEASSDILDWRFVLQASQTRFSFFNRNNSIYLLVSLLLLGGSIGVTLLVINRLTRPLQIIQERYAGNFWRGILTGEIAVDEDAFEEMHRQEFVLNVPYVVLAAENINPPSHPKIRAVRMQKDLFAIILRDVSAANSLCRSILQQNPSAWIGMSGRRNTATALQTAFIEASEALKYKFCADNHVIDWTRVISAKPFQYDHAMETALVNYVITGNQKEALVCLNKIFDSMHSSMIEDNVAVSVVYRLENAILRGVSFLSLPFPEETSLPVDILRSELERFVISVCEAVNELNNTDRTSVWEQVLFEIERNFTQADFCLDYLAESLGMKKAFVSKCIKENTGDSFPEFINKKRVALAKILLCDTDASVEAVAEQVGFNYSYYFIRIFKKYEGITPKIFRDTYANG